MGIRRAPYNREVILFGRWRIPYAPAYGWRTWLRDLGQMIVRTHPAYRPNDDEKP